MMTADQIFRGYVRLIGVGAMATAVTFGILNSLKIVAGAFSIAARASKHGENHSGPERTDRDISVMSMLIGTIVTTLGWRSFSDP